MSRPSQASLYKRYISIYKNGTKMVPFVWPSEKMMLYLGIIKKYKHMFWILFVIFIFIGCSIAYVIDLFEQMKTSEYEIVRIIYWVLTAAFFIAAASWALSW